MNKQTRHLGFTIVELLVAMFLLVILLGISAMVFKHAVQAQRVAAATAEIMQKYNAITHQLRTDLQGLDKSAEICVAWIPGIDTDGDDTVDIFTRMDRIYFFTTGGTTNYNTYNTWPVLNEPDQVLYGNIARVCYMLAGDGNGTKAAYQPAADRNLGRSQHLFTPKTVQNPNDNPLGYPDGSTVTFPVDTPVTVPQTYSNFTAAQDNYYEFDTITAALWTTGPTWPPAGNEKADMVEQIIDIDVYPPTGGANRGIQINPASALNLHMLMAQGVGQFKVQGWFEPQMRWLPEIDPDGDGDLTDTDFFPNGNGIDAVTVPGILYPGKLHGLGPGYTSMYGGQQYPLANLNLANFDDIPGLGTALKFTFTLYDSRGVFPEGKTFTCIVDL